MAFVLIEPKRRREEKKRVVQPQTQPIPPQIQQTQTQAQQQQTAQQTQPQTQAQQQQTQTQPAQQQSIQQQPAEPIYKSTEITVYSVQYDWRNRRLTIDLEVKEPTYISVTCWYNIYGDVDLKTVKSRHGGIFWEGSVSGRKTISISGVPATYFNAGISIDKYRWTEAYGYISSGTLAEIKPDKISGFNEYFEYRREALSKSKIGYNHIFPLLGGYALGGFVAVYNISVDPDAMTMTIDLEVDGSTRYGDINSVWFGSSGWMRWSVGTGRNTVTMKWGDAEKRRYWSDLNEYGLYIFLRDIGGSIIKEIVVKPEELGLK